MESPCIACIKGTAEPSPRRVGSATRFISKSARKKAHSSATRATRDHFMAPSLFRPPRIVRVLEDVQKPSGHHLRLLLRQRSNFHRGPFVRMLRSRVFKVFDHRGGVAGIVLHIVAHGRGRELARPPVTPLALVIEELGCAGLEFRRHVGQHEHVHGKNPAGEQEYQPVCSQYLCQRNSLENSDTM